MRLHEKYLSSLSFYLSVEKMLDGVFENIPDFQVSYWDPHNYFCLSHTHSGGKREYQFANYNEVNYKILILCYFFPFSKSLETKFIAF